MYFKYSQDATIHLKKRDKALGKAIDFIGPIEREVNQDIFSSIIKHIVGQQISTAAQQTIYKRLLDKFGDLNAKIICQCPRDELQACGLSFRKVDYMQDFAKKVHDGDFLVDELATLSDAEVIKKLSALRGIGVWTAEMLLIFCLQRPNILSYGDLAIIRGMCMLYGHEKIDKKLFDKYAKRYTPYASVASLYLWAIAGGAYSVEK